MGSLEFCKTLNRTRRPRCEFISDGEDNYLGDERHRLLPLYEGHNYILDFGSAKLPNSNNYVLYNPQTM